jgi:two-component system chemotaxis response regulator CheB
MAVIRVLVVEDSLTQRHQLVSLIQKAPGMTVAGQARDGLEALALIKKVKPDVISMDIRMPRLDGLETTRHIMEQHPTPIVIVSHAASDAELAIQAMQAGALAALEKPPARNHPDFARRCDELLSMLRLMAGVSVIRHWNAKPRPAAEQRSPLPPALATGNSTGTNQSPIPEIVAIGASAGGPGALSALLTGLMPTLNLPILITQHLTAEFMPGLAEWLNRSGPLSVRLAAHGDVPRPGEVLLAPGGVHMSLSAEGRIVLDSNKGAYRHQPAVDALFESVAQGYGPRAIGVVLTGMGDDGAAGLRAMRDAGAHTIAQDEATCVVFGMPGAAIALGAAEFVLPLKEISSAILALSDRGEGREHGSDSSAH